MYALALTLVAALLAIACERAIAKALVAATTPAKARASRSEGARRLLAARSEAASPLAIGRARARLRPRARAQVRALETFSSMATTACSYIAGGAWNNYIKARWLPGAEVLPLLVYTCGVTATGVFATGKLAESYPKRQAAAIAIDFKKARAKVNRGAVV